MSKGKRRKNEFRVIKRLIILKPQRIRASPFVCLTTMGCSQLFLPNHSHDTDGTYTLFFPSTSIYYSGQGKSYRARRKPKLLFVSVGVLLLRFATRQFVALLFQLPPRFTRLEPPPSDEKCLSICSTLCPRMKALTSASDTSVFESGIVNTFICMCFSVFFAGNSLPALLSTSLFFWLVS